MGAMVDFLMRVKLDYSNPKSSKIKKMISPLGMDCEKGEYAFLRDFKQEIEEINDNIVWVNDKPEPKHGVNPVYDAIMGQIKRAE